jgi:hypothetical protein
MPRYACPARAISRREIVELPPELEFNRPELEEKYDRAVSGYMQRIADLYAAIADRFGEEGLELIREVSCEYGRRIAENVKKKRDLKGVAEVGKYLLKVFDMVSDDLEITEFNDERLVISVSRCPYPFHREEICRAHTHMEKTLVATLDPDLEHYVGKSIPKGDSCCEHIVIKR